MHDKSNKNSLLYVKNYKIQNFVLIKNDKKNLIILIIKL